MVRKGASGNQTGISFSDGKRQWTAKEDAIVSEFFSAIGALKVSALLHNRTPSAIRHRAERLGLVDYGDGRKIPDVFVLPGMDADERAACRDFSAAMRAMPPAPGQPRALL